MNVLLQKSTKMLDQKLKDIWNNSSKGEQISIETQSLTKELNNKVEGIQQKIKGRDTREMVASIIGILLFVYLLIEIPFPITKLACGLAIVWFIFVLIKFRKSSLKNTKADLSLTVARQLEHQRVLMIKQADLMDSALFWYAIPPFIMNFLFIIGLEDPMEYNWNNSLAQSYLPLDNQVKMITLIGLALLYIFIFWRNKKALNKTVKPVIESIEEMQEQINKDINY